jgi:HK97 family phage major capsid protein
MPEKTGIEAQLERLLKRRREAADQRQTHITNREAIHAVAQTEGREDLDETETRDFRALTASIAESDQDLAALDERIAELSGEAERSRKVEEGARRVRQAQAAMTSVNEGLTYVKGNGRSYLRDLAVSTLNLPGSTEARVRLECHAQELQSRPEARAGLDRIDASGGYFVPPAWMVNQYVEFNRAARATANLVQNLDLPPGTDSLSVPTIATGTAVGMQDGDNTAVTETDATLGVVTFGVKTVAGQQTVAQQLLDQSPINFDQVIFKDLQAAHSQAVDNQVINGSDANGQVEGILLSDGIIAISYTDTTPTVQELYAKLADAIQRIHTQRFASPTVIVMHPRRWAWFQNSFDASNRPLVVPSGPASNAIATFDQVASQTVVGNLLGLPVVTDPNIPTNKGTGTNEDVILTMKADDAVLFESTIRARVLPEVLSNTPTF